MLVLGLNSAHDSGVALVDDGRIVGLMQRERLTRIKRSALLTAEFIEECLGWFGVSWSDIDLVAMSTSQSWPILFVDRREFCVRLADELDIPDRPKGHTSASLKHALEFIGYRDRKHPEVVSAEYYRKYFHEEGPNSEYFLEKPSEFLLDADDFLPLLEWPSMPTDWLAPDLAARTGGDLLQANRIRLRNYLPASFTLRGQTRPGLLMPHHLAHAAGAYFQSDLDSAVVHTLDNGDVFTPFRGYVGGMLMLGQGNRLLPVAPSYGYHGHLYQRVSEALGLGHGGGAGKLMGLAPYGDPRYFDHSMVGDSFEVFGESYSQGAKQSRDAVLEMLRAKVKDIKRLDLPQFEAPSRHFDESGLGSQNLNRPGIDVAATAQAVFEHCTLSILSKFLKFAYEHTRKSSIALCLGGGGALNCPVNSAMWRTLPVSDVFVPPACDDSGLPVGAAMAAFHDYLDRPRVAQGSKTCGSAYLGRQYDDRRIREAIDLARGRVIVEEVVDAASDAAAAIAAGRIVAWYEGRSEIGPRALGHRSILADARDPNTWRRVNDLKKREYWRPFAPAVLVDDYDRCFRGSPSVSPHMLFTATVKGEGLPGITHVDGSARVQTVDATCGEFHRVLGQFKQLTGVPVVLNTSFNGPGEPIIDSPEDAIRFAETSEIDGLYIGSYKVSRGPH